MFLTWQKFTFLTRTPKKQLSRGNMNRRRLIPKVNIACLLIITFLSLQFMRGWHEFRKDPNRKIPAEKVLSEKKHSERKPLSYYSIIEKRNLFGETCRSEFRVVKSAPVSGFRLRGTAVLNSGGGYAILEDTKGEQKLCMLGDTVGDGKLVRVEWERIVLRSSDGERTLAMVSPVSTETNTIQKKEITQIVKNKHVLPRSFVNGAIANANQILTQVRVKPYFVSGISEGYWVGNIQPGSIIEKMGLQNGDIVKSVNGETLDSPEKIFQVYQQVRETGTVSVDVERDGTIVTLTYEIRD